MDLGSDPAPFETTVREHAAAARRLALRLVRDADDAEDVAQESMRIVLERPAAPGRPAWPWLAGVVRNVARALRRRRAGAARDVRAPSRPPPEDPAELAEAVEAQRRVLDALLALEEPYRGTLILRYVKDLEPKEIAALHAVPLETVRTRLRRGVARLREAMDARHGGDRSRWTALLLPLLPERRLVPVAVATAAGGLAVKKLAAVAAALLLVAGTTWWVLGSDANRGRSPGDEVVATGSEAARLQGRATTVPVDPALETAFATVDRDRDLHGVVVRGDGTPVASARTRAVRRPWRDLPLIDLERHLVAQDVATGVTGIDGTFRLPCPPGREISLEVGAEGLATVEVARCQPGERLRVVLRDAVRLEIVVREASGAAAAGCVVQFDHYEGKQSPGTPYDRSAIHRHGTTDAQGRITFDALPAGARGTLVVEPSSGGARAWERFDLPGSGTLRREIVLSAGRTLRGRVLDARTGRGIPGARVGIDWPQRQAVLAGAEGRYALAGWKDDGQPAVYASAAGYGQTGVKVQGREEVDVELPPAFRVMGRLVDALGVPVPDARVVVGMSPDADPNTSTRLATTSDAEGRFALDQLRVGSHELIVAADGVGRVAFDVQPRGSMDAVDLGDVVVPAAGTILGRVLGRGGEPQAGVSVVLRGSNDDRGRYRPGVGFPSMPTTAQRRLTDDLGRFRFGDLAPGHYVAAVESGAFPIPIPDVAVALAEGETRAVDLRWAEGRTVRVHVEWTAPPPSPLPTVGVVERGRSTHVAKVDAHGDALLEVPRRAVQVRLGTPGMGWFASPPIDVSAGTDEVTLRLERAEPIRGVLVGPEGTPLARASVQARIGDEYQSNVVTDEEGRFELRVRPRSRNSVVFDGGFQVPRDDHRYEEEERPLAARADDVPAGSASVVLRAKRLPEGRRLRVRVLTPDGAPAGGASVRMDQQRSRRRMDAKGEAVIEGLIGRPTRVDAMAAYDDLRTKGWLPTDVTLVPDGQEIELRLRQGIVVRGRVLDGSGSPLANATVQGWHGDRELMSALSGPDGVFDLPADPAEWFPMTLVVGVAGSKATFETTLDAPPTGEVVVRPPP